MAKALSIDLRSRVVAAIGSGMSCRQAAVRFGVSASSAIRWRALERSRGDARPKVQGGDRRSERVEKHSERILALVETTPDMTLTEIRTVLVKEGAMFGIATLWRFFDRRQITWKKRLRMLPSRTAPTS